MDPRRRRVSEIMKTQVATLDPNEYLDLAEDITTLARVRHMPVLEGERLVGIVSERDLMAVALTRILAFEPDQQRSFMRSVQVEEAMTRDIATISPDAPLAEAAEQMLKRRIHCLPVVAGSDVLIGLVTDTDLLRAGFVSERGEGNLKGAGDEGPARSE